MVGAFVPDDRPGKVVLYAICDTCLIFPDAQDQIEAAIYQLPQMRVRP
jgi:hypothetical protein